MSTRGINTNTRAYKEAKGFKVICISLYSEDEKGLNERVEKLRALGWGGANKSALIRLALSKLDDSKLDELVREMLKRGRR